MSLLAYGLIARWHLMPWLTSVSRKRAFTPLLLLHSFRHIGLAFLIPGVTAQALDPRFANPAAYGDLLAGVLALLALLALRMDWPVAILLVWIFNIFGTVDLLNALMQGMRHNPPGSMGSTHFIPAVIVPALLVTHYLIFVRLLRREEAAA